jgi:hypothetical protein
LPIAVKDRSDLAGPVDSTYESRAGLSVRPRRLGHRTLCGLSWIEEGMDLRDDDAENDSNSKYAP